ncbi:MAG TPA: glycerol-3-phosphate dehydrogenase/oxidase [Candidatus Binataceae bacterium]|nr:glycerol-3-phosphate dehydrogenase/oxidase [Candidatus Binataceae bacterium]
MGRESFDLAVIGGGINGAAIARDAAMRGLSVALIERGDFAGATSSRSSKLIHGGLRYLPQGHLGLVRRALAERERLRRLTAPHLVRPLRFLFPLYRERGPGRLALGAGLWLYDLFARTPRAERHRSLSRAATVAAEPILRSQGLVGGASYYDAEGDDARITLENALDAAWHGAALANYVALEGFSHIGSRIGAAGVRDRLGGASFELRARVFINAAGPWLDDVRRLDAPAAPPVIRLTKGVHLIFDRTRLPVGQALVLSDGAGRIVFVIPYGLSVLVGTTDTDFAGDREHVATDETDVAYLIYVLQLSLETDLAAADVAAGFAGLRALGAAGDGRAPSAVSREEVIVESASGLISVGGGKLTTHREIAERVVNRVASVLGRGGPSSPTRDTPLPGARPLRDEESVDGRDDRAVATRALGALPADLRAAIVARYGSRAAIVARIAFESPELAAPLADGCAVAAAEAVYAMRYEMATSVADFIVRRTALSWRNPRCVRAAAVATARLMASELGWDRARQETEAAACDTAGVPGPKAAVLNPGQDRRGLA